MTKIIITENTELQKIVNDYQNYIEKFCELSERSASYLDEWGDENLDSLSQYKKECVIRIARKVYDNERFTPIKAKLDYLINCWFDIDNQNELKIIVNTKAPSWVQSLFNDYLPQEFSEYHKKRKENPQDLVPDLNKMTGVEFENYVANLLKQIGYNVSGTSATGDQGADLIATKNDKIYVIQVKRYSGTVGNKAIQEVVAAKKYYNGDVAAVATNSSFTPSAVKLAKINNVILLPESSFQSIDAFLNNKF